MSAGSGRGRGLLSGMTVTEDKQDIQAFWGALYDSLYSESDKDLTREELLEGLDALEDMFRLRAHMAVVEMPLSDLAGKRVLEIGPGAGGASSETATQRYLCSASIIAQKFSMGVGGTIMFEHPTMSPPSSLPTSHAERTSSSTSAGVPLCTV